MFSGIGSLGLGKCPYHSADMSTPAVPQVCADNFFVCEGLQEGLRSCYCDTIQVFRVPLVSQQGPMVMV